MIDGKHDIALLYRVCHVFLEGRAFQRAQYNNDDKIDYFTGYRNDLCQLCGDD